MLIEPGLGTLPGRCDHLASDEPEASAALAHLNPGSGCWSGGTCRHLLPLAPVITERAARLGTAAISATPRTGACCPNRACASIRWTDRRSPTGGSSSVFLHAVGATIAVSARTGSTRHRATNPFTRTAALPFLRPRPSFLLPGGHAPSIQFVVPRAQVSCAAHPVSRTP